jgi:membrane protease YdiL (CAAX protease family)
LDTLLAIVVWGTGFVLLRRFGTFLPLTCGAVSLAAVFLARDPALRAALRPSARTLGLAALFTVAMIAATYVLYPLALRLWPSLADQTQALYALLRPDRYAAPLMAGLLGLTAASEEVIFRGRLLPETGALWRRCLISSAIYVAAHFAGGSWLLIALAFSCGFFWAFVRVFTGSLLAAILVHAIWDLCTMVLHPL